MLKGKNILLGVTGSIAAYKAAILVRLLIKNRANVKVLMSDLAKEFITPLTLATLSKNPVLIDFFDPEDGSWNSHVDIGIWADAYVVAPATANTMAKMASGIADNLLLTTYLSSRCPVFIAPAMDLDMFRHPATARNIEVLRGLGNILIEPSTGELASGLEGKGRMEEPEKIIEELVKYFEKKKSRQQSLLNKKVLITAGPTYENIDPVRFIGNYSTGKMGYALAQEALNRGAEVVMISGPVSVSLKHPNLNILHVHSAREMLEASELHFKSADISILSAAVADFRPKEEQAEKIKEKDGFLLELVPNPDIAKTLGGLKRSNQLLIGFALETYNEQENAHKKLLSKNFDLIVLNSLKDEKAGFGYDTNKITIIGKDNKSVNYELKTKAEVAVDILDAIECL